MLGAKGYRCRNKKLYLGFVIQQRVQLFALELEDLTYKLKEISDDTKLLGL